MAVGKPPLSKKNVASYITIFIGIACVFVIAPWAIYAFWTDLITIIIWLNVAALVIAGLVFAYCIYLAYRTIGFMRKGRFGSTPVERKLVVVSLIMIVGSIGTYIGLESPSWVPTDMYPHLSFTSDPATSMTLTWTSTSSYTGRVMYGTSPSNMSLVLQDPGPTENHVLKFTGLTPNTHYYYNITQFGKTWSFKTASNQNDNLKFIAISDLHAPSTDIHVSDMQAWNPDFYVLTGDIVDLGFSNAEWNDLFSILSPVATNCSIMTAIGNHDLFVNREQNYVKYLSMPMASTGIDLYYHIKYNGVNFFSLYLDYGLDTFDSAQLAWFQSEMAAIPAGEWIIVYNHCSYISSGEYNNATGNSFKLYSSTGDMMDYFHDYFVSHHVNLVITGHDHHFEISKWDGVVYAIVGIGNTKLDTASSSNNTNSIWYEPGYTGFMGVQINGSTCTLTGHLYQNDVLTKTVVYSFSR